MGRAGVARAQNAPLRIVPQRGQRPENFVKSPVGEEGTVFHEDESGQNFADDSRHVSPHPGLRSADSCASARGADILTRKSA